MSPKSYLLALSCLLAVWRESAASYDPHYGERSSIFYNVSGAQRYPDLQHIVEDEYLEFISSLNFDAVPGSILVGAKDHLFLLSEDLTELEDYSWPVNATCSPDSRCDNHIRVFKEVPGQDGWLFVCGTQQANNPSTRPQCRIVEISGGTFTPHMAVEASDGIISYYPELSGFGEFRSRSNADPVYFSAGYFDGTSGGIAKDFSISYQNVTFTGNDPDSLMTSENFKTEMDNNYWLRFPVKFVDYYRADYPSSGSAEDYQFYFVFLTENRYDPDNEFDIIYSRVVRICRNDRGTVTADGDIFNTYMKARIFCQREVPSVLDFPGAITYEYNELRSVTINDGNGRYSRAGSSNSWAKRMYGAFSGPAVGPEGTALCVYPADNSIALGDGRNQGIFDVFRDDIVEVNIDDSSLNREVENLYLECSAAGRPDGDTNEIPTVQIVKQVETDPLLVLDGVIVTQMDHDQTCVVEKDMPTRCYNQDVLFLGTDDGRVLKVVFGVGSTSSTTIPIIAEEIQLDDDNAVEKLVIEDDHVYVNTLSRLYRFPVERCSRHTSCSECVGSRDPYCFWNMNGNCERSPQNLANGGAAGTVGSQYLQNIHTGLLPSCSVPPDCELILSALDFDTIQVELDCSVLANVLLTVNIPTINVINSPLNLDTNGHASASYDDPSQLGFSSHDVTITTPSGHQFSGEVTTLAGPPADITSDQIFIVSTDCRSLSITVNIAVFTDLFSNYEITVTPSPGTPQTQRLADGMTVEISGLSPAQTISLTVTVANSVGSDSYSIAAYRLCDDVPEEVQNLSVALVTATEIRLVWNQPAVRNGDIIGYSVTQGSTQITNCVENSGSSVTGNTYTVSGLTPATTYSFTVRACTSAGEGPGVTITQKTLCSGPGAVQGFAFSDVTASSFRYSWSPPDVPNGDLNLYQTTEVCYQDPETRNVMSGVQTPQTVTNLDPLTLCCVTVIGINQCNGMDFPGTPVEQCQETLDIVPGEVQNVAVTTASHRALIVTWDPPVNYNRPGLNYSVMVMSSGMQVQSLRSINRQSVYIDGLSGNTPYTISVMAVSSVGSSSAVQEMGATLFPPPPAPTNVALSFTTVGSVTLTVRWDDDAADSFNVMSYEVCMRCNDVDTCEDTGSLTTERSFSVSSPMAYFTWCTAQVRSENNIGKSNFSELAQLVYPLTAPSQPRCFLQDNYGGSVNITFAVTYPFIPVNLEVRYNWTSQLGNSDSGSFPFESDTANDVLVSVSRNTTYDFQLWLCNDYGCSEPCQDLRSFTTSSASPNPPSSVTVSDITTTSANVSWERPITEDETTVNYTVQVTGGGDLLTVTLYLQQWWYFDNLKPQTDYTAAVRLTDRFSGVVGLFGPGTDFTTETAVPSPPRSVMANYVVADQKLEVFWLPPSQPGGTILYYEVEWSDSPPTSDCSNPSRAPISAVQMDPAVGEFSTRNTGNINMSSSALICVRAFNNKIGEWASDSLVNHTRGAVSQPCDSEDIAGLIAVAVVAGLSVLSTIVMGIILAVVILKRVTLTQSMHKESKTDHRFQQNGGEKSSTLYSQSSVSSQAPLVSSDYSHSKHTPP